MEDLIDVFSDQYDVEVNNYRAGSESVLQRILQEDEAGYYGADIFETNADEVGRVLQDCALALAALSDALLATPPRIDRVLQVLESARKTRVPR